MPQSAIEVLFDRFTKLGLQAVHAGVNQHQRHFGVDRIAVWAGRDEIELILRRWITSPHHYRDDFKEWNRSRPTTGYMLYFDFVLLRKTPLIEARPGELICPSIPFLLQKVVDEPYFILSDYLKEPGRFQAALGYAYQKYAQRLVERVTASDAGGAWEFKHSPRDHKGRELSDSYLQRGRIAVSFEHKGQRPGTDFLRGGSGERVLGPCETVLARLDKVPRLQVKGPRCDHVLCALVRIVVDDDRLDHDVGRNLQPQEAVEQAR